MFATLVFAAAVISSQFAFRYQSLTFALKYGCVYAHVQWVAQTCLSKICNNLGWLYPLEDYPELLLGVHSRPLVGKYMQNCSKQSLTS